MLIDLLVVVIIGLFVWGGFNKGFFLTASSILILFASVMIGANVANGNAEKASVVFDGILDWVAETATEEAVEKLGVAASNVPSYQLVPIIKEAFESLGIRGAASDYLASQVRSSMLRQPDATLYEVISQYFIRAIAWIALFFAGFAISALVLSLIVNFISTVFKLPVIRQLDMFGGLGLGLINGIFIMFIAGFALRYIGFILPDGLIESTNLLRFFVDKNPFGSVIKL